METIWSGDVKARKQHRCYYCGNVIEKGEVYHKSKHKYDGSVYEWKCHCKCNDIASEIWDYVDPDNGMTDDDFCDNLRDIADTFICPECPYHDNDSDDCDCSLDMKCIDHIHQFFQKYRLVCRVPYCFKVEERTKEDKGEK